MKCFGCHHASGFFTTARDGLDAKKICERGFTIGNNGFKDASRCARYSQQLSNGAGTAAGHCYLEVSFSIMNFLDDRLQAYKLYKYDDVILPPRGSHGLS